MSEPTPDWALELTKNITAALNELKADIGLVSNDLGILKDRVTLLEAFRSEQDARATRASAGVRGLSNTDMAHEAAIASLTTKMDALSTTQDVQLAILGRLDKLASNPSVKIILTVAATAIASWAASRGLK